MQLLLVTPPAAPLISLAEAKAHLRVEHDVENDYIPTLAAAAEALVAGRDGWTGRALTEQTWRLTLPGFPLSERLRLPFPPLVSVTHVKYYPGPADVGVEGPSLSVPETFDPARYVVMVDDTPGFIQLLATFGWPSTYPRADAVEIEFVCGYATVPAPIKHAALIVLAALYRNRGDEQFAMPEAVRRLLAPYKTWAFNDRA